MFFEEIKKSCDFLKPQDFCKMLTRFSLKIIQERSLSPNYTVFSLKNIYGSVFSIFKRYPPTNGSIKPFVGEISFLSHIVGCGGRTRTYDLRVMSPTSYHLLHSAIFKHPQRECLIIISQTKVFVNSFF